MTIIRLMRGSFYWLVLTLTTYCSCYDLCSGNRDCSCQETERDEWLVRCFHDGFLEFTFNMNWRILPEYKLECNQSVSWYDAEFRQAKLPGSAGVFHVFGCSLPDESFSTVFPRLGLKSTFWLTFSSYQKLGRSLTRQHLSGLRQLVMLELSENGLTELTGDLLHDLPTLTMLRLSSNEITSLPRGIFEGLSRLKYLYLDNNQIEVLDPLLFRNCTSLSNLYLKQNLLTTVDNRLFDGLLDLTHLVLDNNPLEITSNHSFESLKGLQNLHISGCQFSSLPEGLFRRMKSIRLLKLCDNRGNLTTLPKQLFNNPTSAFDVYLERNRFSRLSENTFRGSIKLRRLVLTGNAFSTLPENIFSDSLELVLLDLSDNGLTDLPDGLFQGLTQLTNLTLSHNRITSLPENLFAELIALRELDLSFNRMSQIRAQVFRNLANLRIARLSHNAVSFPEDIQYLLYDCVSLEKLYLDHNSFTRLSIHNWDYWVSPSLRLVDLSYNRLSIIEVENKLPQSMRLVFDLRHNQVQQILTPIRNFAKLVFMLDDNPIHCDCMLYEWNGPVGHDLLTFDPGNATCASPKWMNGMRITDLDWTHFLCRPPQRDVYFRCAEECDCWWRPSDRIRVVDCSSRNLTRVPDRIMQFSDEELSYLVDQDLAAYVWRGRATELSFEKNHLTEIPSFDEPVYDSVRRIFLSFNNLSVVSRIPLPPNLQVLRLDHCNLTRFETTALDDVMNSTTLKEVDLDENPWDCHRDTRNALLAIDNKFKRVTKYTSGEHVCLDPGRVRHGEEEHQLYISYTRFLIL